MKYEVLCRVSTLLVKNKTARIRESGMEIDRIFKKNQVIGPSTKNPGIRYDTRSTNNISILESIPA
jgi:hypothetical protein